MAKCPVCRQPLPEALDMEELQSRLEGITARARTQEKQALETQFRKRLLRLLEAERERARRSAEHEVKQELLDAKRRAYKAKRYKTPEIHRLWKDAEPTPNTLPDMGAQSMPPQS